MKVLHVDEQTGWRGGEQQASWLIQGLAVAGHEIWIAGRPGRPFLEHAHGGAALRRVALPLRGEVDVLSAWRLGRLVRAERIDILHAHTSHAHAIACLARGIAGCGRVVVARRVSFPPRQNLFNRRKYACPDRFISVSNKVDAELAAFGVPAWKRRVVHSVVDPRRLAVPPLSRDALGVPGGVPLLVSAGALVGHKDHANLLAALPAVLEHFPDTRLCIAGEGPLRGALEDQAAALRVGHAVRFLGHRDDAPRLIRAADLYVSSSWSEGLGTSILEALACGTPVVAARAGGADEMVLPEKTGRLVPVRDPEALGRAIVAALRDPEGSEAMASAGRDLVEREFTVPSMVAGTIAVYEELLGEK